MKKLVLLFAALLVAGCGEKSSSEGSESVGENPTAPSEEVKPVEEKQQEVKPVDPNLKYETEGDAVTITGCDKKASGALIIPVTIEGKTVTSIGSDAFGNCSSLTSITIPDSVTSIGEAAFAGCTSLRSITFIGTAPTVGANAFLGVADGATAYVYEQFVASFGTEGSTWVGFLTVASQRPFAITACGFVNATTFFIEFEPAGAGYRVMSSSTLDFGNAVEVTPTLQPTSASDNRFEFAASGSRNFYRLEPVQ